MQVWITCQEVYVGYYEDNLHKIIELDTFLNF